MTQIHHGRRQKVTKLQIDQWQQNQKYGSYLNRESLKEIRVEQDKSVINLHLSEKMKYYHKPSQKSYLDQISVYVVKVLLCDIMF